MKIKRPLKLPSKFIVNTPGTFIGKTSRQIVVRKDKKKLFEYPSLHLKDIIISGKGISLSSDVIEYCAANDIPMFFISPTGKTSALFTVPYSSSPDLGLLQLKYLQNTGMCLQVARLFIKGKIKNQINIAGFFSKNSCHSTFLQECIRKMEKIFSEITDTGNYLSQNSIFNVEARASNIYWKVFKIILNEKYDFKARYKRNATDIVNSMLNYGYAILEGRVRLAIMRCGLNPEISFLHSIQKGRASLVFDLMEEFRQPLIDKTVLDILNKEDNDLELTKQGLLSDNTKSILINAIMEKLDKESRFEGKKLKLEEIIDYQAISLSKHLEGSARYQPFIQSYRGRSNSFFCLW